METGLGGLFMDSLEIMSLSAQNLDEMSDDDDHKKDLGVLTVNIAEGEDDDNADVNVEKLMGDLVKLRHPICRSQRISRRPQEEAESL